MKNKTLVSIVVAVVIILIGGAIALAFNVWNPSWNPFHNNSLSIEKAIAKTLNHKTYKVDSNVELRLKGDISNQKLDLPIKVDVSSLIDKSVKDSPKTLLKVKLSFNFLGIDLSGEVEGIITKKVAYFRVTKTPAMFTSFMPAVQNQWYKIDVSQANQNGENEEKAKEMSEKILELVKGKNIFKIEKKYGKEKIGNYEAVHYLVGLNKKSTKELIPQIVKIITDYLPKNGRSKEDIEAELNDFDKNFNENFESFWQKVQPLNFDFWLKDNEMVAVSFDKLFNLKELSKGSNDQFVKIGGQQMNINQIEVKIKEVYSDFDKKVEIEIPKNAKEFK